MGDIQAFSFFPLLFLNQKAEGTHLKGGKGPHGRSSPGTGITL